MPTFNFASGLRIIWARCAIAPASTTVWASWRTMANSNEFTISLSCNVISWCIGTVEISVQLKHECKLQTCRTSTVCTSKLVQYKLKSNSPIPISWVQLNYFGLSAYRMLNYTVHIYNSSQSIGYSIVYSPLRELKIVSLVSVDKLVSECMVLKAQQPNSSTDWLILSLYIILYFDWKNYLTIQFMIFLMCGIAQSYLRGVFTDVTECRGWNALEGQLRFLYTQHKQWHSSRIHNRLGEFWNYTIYSTSTQCADIVKSNY